MKQEKSGGKDIITVYIPESPEMKNKNIVDISNSEGVMELGSAKTASLKHERVLNL